jgi:hypothetical protein
MKKKKKRGKNPLAFLIVENWTPLEETGAGQAKAM